MIRKHLCSKLQSFQKCNEMNVFLSMNASNSESCSCSNQSIIQQSWQCYHGDEGILNKDEIDILLTVTCRSLEKTEKI